MRERTLLSTPRLFVGWYTTSAWGVTRDGGMVHIDLGRLCATVDLGGWL